MTRVIGSDGLSFYVENAAGSGAFDALPGMSITRVDVEQRLADSTAVTADAWANVLGVAARRVLVEAEALATDSVVAERLRDITLSGESSLFRLALTTERALQCAAFVTHYREITQPGEMKHVQVRLESTGEVTVV